MNKSVMMPQQECPVVQEVDVLVLGGGATGIGAAIGAAQNGAKVALVEQYGALGGSLTLGLITNCEAAVAISGDKILIKGVFDQLVERMVSKKGAIRGWELIKSNKYYPFDTSRCENDLQITIWDPDIFKMSADELMMEKGVSLYFYTMATEVLMDGSKVIGMVIENKGGRQVIYAKRVVDASGDAFVARRAGAEVRSTSMMKDGKGPLTLMFRVGGVKNVTPSYKPDIKEIPYGAVNFFPLLREGEIRVEMTRYSGNGIDPDDLTRGTVICRKQVIQVLDYLKANWTGFEDSYLLDTAPMIGSLSYPKIVGVKSITQKNVLEQHIPDDRIALTAYGLDIHSAEEGGQNYLYYLKPGQYYGISYGIMIPEAKVEDLLVAGRTASSEDGAESAIFCSAISMALGEAAGTACALSVKMDISPRDIDVALVQKSLVEHGAILDPVPVPKVIQYPVYAKR